MAAVRKAIIFYHCNLFFVSVDERSAIGSQPNLASRSEVVLIYQLWSDPFPKFGAQKH